MSTRHFSIVAGAVIATAALTAYIANAGDINPPAGPIEGTGVSTSQFAGLQSGSLTLVKEFEAAGIAYQNQSDPAFVSKITGSGILHAIILGGPGQDGFNSISVEDNNGTPIGAFTAVTSTTSLQQSKIILNIRYADGVRVRRLSNASGYTLIYAPDSP